MKDDAEERKRGRRGREALDKRSGIREKGNEREIERKEKKEYE